MGKSLSFIIPLFTMAVVGCLDNLRSNWVPLLLNLLALIAIAIHGSIYGSKLQGEVAYHYDAYGNPDKTTPVATFIALYWLSAIISSVFMFFLSIVFATNCCATSCTSPEEASYTPSARRYLRLVVAAWALWLNLAVLLLIFAIFAVLLQNALKSFDKATSFGVYLPFFIFCACLVVLVFAMITNVQNAKRLMYMGFFKDDPHDMMPETTAENNSEELRIQ